MSFKSLCFLGLATVALAADRPAPALNANPTDTSNPRLVGKLFPFNAIPAQVDTSGGARGPQTGFNICNSTTENQNSLCQTLIVNSIDDFCIWAPPSLLAIGDSEDREVAWCTKAGHGGRIIPPGTFTALQFINTPSYVAITGQLDQTKVNIPGDDFGGELDSGGQDDRGNPIGALVYSNAMPSTKGTVTQSRTWHMFIGGGQFCFKACDNNAPDALGLCEHVYDRIGCKYNVPAAYAPNVFLSCQGEDQDPVGVFTVNGVVSTYRQEPEGVTPNPPYQPRIPVTSACQTFQSAQLFTATVVGGSSSSSTTTASSTSGSSTSTSKAGGSGGSSGSGGSPTGGSSASNPSGTSGSGNAAPRAVSGAGVLALLISASALLLGAAVIA